LILKNAFLPALLCAAFAAAASEPQVPDADLLANTTIFKLGFVGIAAHISEEELALARLLKNANAGEQLLALLQNAKSNEAKLYALCGLRNASKAIYEKSATLIRWDGDTYNRMTADVVRKAPVKEQLDRMTRDGCAVKGN
jgi:hypothetical protein